MLCGPGQAFVFVAALAARLIQRSPCAAVTFALTAEVSHDQVVIDMTMSLDGFVADPDDGADDPLGRHGGMHLFDWYFSGHEDVGDPLFWPEPGANRDQVERMFAESGAFVFGRRTYEITGGWGGRHPVNGAPVFVLTRHPPDDYPRGPSNLTFITDGIESAIHQARAVADGKDVKLGGASPAKQALAAGLCDEILIHLAPFLLGGGVRLFDPLPNGIQLEKLSVSDGPFATHIRYGVIQDRLSERIGRSDHG